MDRFFSKLDLRDIKIDPFKTSYPPDAEDDAVEDEPAATSEQVPAPLPPDRDERRPHVPAWAAPADVPAPAPVAFAGEDDEEPGLAVDATGPGRNGANGAAANGAAAATNGHAAYAAPSEVETVAAAEVDVLGSTSEVLKVSARSRPSAVAGAIAGVVREAGRAEVQAIGAGATNQAVKAVAIARDYLRETGIEAVCLPAFIDITIENEDRTAIRLVVEPR